MAYIVYNSSGTYLTSIPTGKINTGSTSLALIGKDVSNYGQYLNQNLVNLLSSFSSPNAPKNPVTGQLWYDITYKKLKIFSGTFQAVGSAITSSAQPPGQSPGEFWYDTANKELNFVDTQGQYNAITSFPRTVVSGWKYPVTPVTDDLSNVQSVTLLRNYGETIGALSRVAFTASNIASTTTFVTANTSSFELVSGMNVIGDTKVTGSLYVEGTSGISSVVLSGYNQKGGTGYHGFLEATNRGASVGKSKFFRLNSTGALEIVNNSYATTILSLTDAGKLTVPSLVVTQATPANTAAAGTLGQIAWDNNYIYVYTSAGWKRLPATLTTF